MSIQQCSSIIGGNVNAISITLRPCNRCDAKELDKTREKMSPVSTNKLYARPVLIDNSLLLTLYVSMTIALASA